MADNEEDCIAGDSKKPFFSASSGSYSNPREGPGFQIGPYRLLSTLGEGGYGVVYLAEQQEPIRRQVALKIVKLGMDTKQVIARFEAERQALALLDHSNIAHIYDAGTTETGRPYFVMELVKGSAITEYCDWQKLDIEERIKLFLHVCDAVQYAHQKGIIHRDIKPSNILVSIEGDRAVPKIIDFGVAKAISQPLTERTLVTEQGQFIGTPEYMSPEQADMAARDIDTRSDIYSLGTVLYELLTGVLPFDPKTFREAGVDRLRQMIREEEPKTPSTRLSSMGDLAQEIAAKRCTKVGSLSKCLHDELEWIPMKAMRKERAYRYQSAFELARDIRNYLDGAPLIAGPESVMYRIKKFLLRWRWPVAAATAIVITLIVGFVVSSILYISAEKARSREANQRNIADAERDRAVKAEQEAKKRLADLYEQQGRRYTESGDLDKALVVLSEAYNVDNQRLSVRFLLAECMRKHENPAFQKDGALIPWDKSAGAAKISAFSVSPDRTCVAFVDESLGVINIFNTTTGRLMAQLPGKAVTRLAFAPGSRHIVVRAEQDSTHHTLKVFDTRDGKEVFSTKRSNTDIDRLYESVDYALPDRGQLAKVYDSLCMSPDGDWFAFVDVVDSDGEPKPEICLWDFKSDELHRAQSQHFSSLITLMGFRPESIYGNASVLYTLDCNDLCQCWDIPTLKPAGQFYYHGESVVFGPNGKSFILFEGQEAELLDRRNNGRLILFQSTRWAGFSPDGRRIITKQNSASPYDTSGVKENFSTNLWDAEDGRHIVELTGKELQNWHFTPDSNYLITEHADAQIKVWSVGNGSLVCAIPSEDTQAVTDISPDSRWLATCSSTEPRMTHIWNIATGESFEPYEDEVWEEDFAATWLSVDTDRIFAFSHRCPKKLLRFNARGSDLITGAGLRHIGPTYQSPGQIRKLVDASIALRFENGKIRSASTEEMLRAKLAYWVMMKGRLDSESIGSLMDLAIHDIQAGELEEASELAKDLQTLEPLHDADLTQRGRNVIKQLSKAYSGRADREHRRGKYAEAITNYESALRFDPNDPLTLEDLAWLQATCPDSQLLDVREALERSKKACELTNWKHWECLSAHAVAYAAGGQFENAIDYQQQSIELLPAEQRHKWGANFQERLRLFQSNQPYNRKVFWNLPINNMIAWWKCNQTQGPNVADSSGNGLAGKLVGAAGIVEDAQRGDVLSIGIEGGHVDCGNDSAFDITDSISVVTWVKVGVFDKESQAIISKGESTWRLYRSWTTDTLTFNCDGLQGLSTPDTGVEGKTNVDDGRWHHIVGTYDGQAIALYVDGILDGSKSARGEIDTNAFPLWIGGNAARTGKRGRDWNGLIDDVRIYNRALRSDEVRELYDATKYAPADISG